MEGDLFTIGHRYLIERAREQVEFLIVFVIEEDVFLFSFEERMQMAEDGIQDMENVMIVPGGEFILSRQTFPQFISKRRDKAVNFNAEYDARIFAEYIAKPMRITHYFVGKEAGDRITEIYHEVLRKILPRRGIVFVEIPKTTENGEIVRSSRIHRYLRNEKYDKAYAMIPERIKQYLVSQS